MPSLPPYFPHDPGDPQREVGNAMLRAEERARVERRERRRGISLIVIICAVFFWLAVRIVVWVLESWGRQ